MRETWFVMEDGSAGDPREIAIGKDGKLEHKDGRKVAYAPHGPRSRGVDVDAARGKAANDAAKAKAAADAKAVDDAKGKVMKPEDAKRGYKTRESKAD